MGKQQPPQLTHDGLCLKGLRRQVGCVCPISPLQVSAQCCHLEAGRMAPASCSPKPGSPAFQVSARSKFCSVSR